MDPLTETAQRLSALSRRHYRSAYATVDWPLTVEQQQWFTSPELISIFGTPYWESLDAIKAFAGDDHETAVFYPEDDRYLLERDLRSTHFEVHTHAAPEG